jgi:dihydroneopterin aldolase
MRFLRDVTIVKIGGSHAVSADLPAWVKAIASDGRALVVVPGGGPFADAVRDAQTNMGFDDHTAHHMALLAMEQYGVVLASLNKKLVLANSVALIRRLLRTGYVPVWSPTRMVLGARDIPASWDVTSDSLSAWLAGKLRSRRLVLVKHLAASEPSVSAAELSSEGVVDPSFPRFLRASGASARIARPSDHAKLGPLLSGEPAPGVRITLHAAQVDEVESVSWRRSKRRAGAGR